MDSNQLYNCKNCGAELEFGTAAAVKCPYCGTVVQNPEAPTESQPVPVVNNVEEDFQSLDQPTTNKGDQKNSLGCILGVLVAIFVVAIVIATIGNQNNDNSTGGYADSTTVDTSTAINKLTDDINENSGKTLKESSIDAALKGLATIKVDTATFKKLYRNIRKSINDESGFNEWYDKTSPRYVNVNAIYVYLIKTNDDQELMFRTQYVADNWLFINGMVIKTDAESYLFNTDFKRGNRDGKIWEWCDEDVPNDSFLTLAKMATAKKVKIKYNGASYSEVVVMTHAQQAALKRQLQIYKGLLLGYDKVKSN